MKTKTHAMLMTAAAAVILLAGFQGFSKEPFKIDAEPDWGNGLNEVKKVFHVGKVGTPGAAAIETRAKLLALYEAMGKSQGATRGIAMSLRVIQGMKNGETVIYFCELNRKRIAVVSRNATIQDGGTLNGTFERAGIYEGETVLGAATRLEQWQECEDLEVANVPTKEDLVKRLKAGETFEVRMSESGACEPCFGRGQMNALKGGGKCKACGGSGNAVVIYKLLW